MRFSIFYIISMLSLNLIFSQKSKIIEVSLIDKVQINNASYYLLGKTKRDTLIVENSKLNLSYDEDEEEVKILVEYNNKCIEFYIRPNEIHYLEIKRLPFKLNNFFRRKFIIDQGFDSVEIVKSQDK
jgi:hypothetical protein